MEEEPSKNKDGFPIRKLSATDPSLTFQSSSYTSNPRYFSLNRGFNPELQRCEPMGSEDADSAFNVPQPAFQSSPLNETLYLSAESCLGIDTERPPIAGQSYQKEDQLIVADNSGLLEEPQRRKINYEPTLVSLSKSKTDTMNNEMKQATSSKSYTNRNISSAFLVDKHLLSKNFEDLKTNTLYSKSSYRDKDLEANIPSAFVPKKSSITRSDSNKKDEGTNVSNISDHRTHTPSISMEWDNGGDIGYTIERSEPEGEHAQAPAPAILGPILTGRQHILGSSFHDMATQTQASILKDAEVQTKSQGSSSNNNNNIAYSHDKIEDMNLVKIDSRSSISSDGRKSFSPREWASTQLQKSFSYDALFENSNNNELIPCDSVTNSPSKNVQSNCPQRLPNIGNYDLITGLPNTFTKLDSIFENEDRPYIQRQKNVPFKKITLVTSPEMNSGQSKFTQTNISFLASQRKANQKPPEPTKEIEEVPKGIENKLQETRLNQISHNSFLPIPFNTSNNSISKEESSPLPTQIRNPESSTLIDLPVIPTSLNFEEKNSSVDSLPESNDSETMLPYLNDASRKSASFSSNYKLPDDQRPKLNFIQEGFQPYISKSTLQSLTDPILHERTKPTGMDSEELTGNYSSGSIHIQDSQFSDDQTHDQLVFRPHTPLNTSFDSNSDHFQSHNQYRLAYECIDRISKKLSMLPLLVQSNKEPLCTMPSFRASQPESNIPENSNNRNPDTQEEHYQRTIPDNKYIELKKSQSYIISPIPSPIISTEDDYHNNSNNTIFDFNKNPSHSKESQFRASSKSSYAEWVKPLLSCNLNRSCQSSNSDFSKNDYSQINSNDSIKCVSKEKLSESIDYQFKTYPKSLYADRVKLGSNAKNPSPLEKVYTQPYYTQSSLSSNNGISKREDLINIPNINNLETKEKMANVAKSYSKTCSKPNYSAFKSSLFHENLTPKLSRSPSEDNFSGLTSHIDNSTFYNTCLGAEYEDNCQTTIVKNVSNSSEVPFKHILHTNNERLNHVRPRTAKLFVPSTLSNHYSSHPFTKDFGQVYPSPSATPKPIVNKATSSIGIQAGKHEVEVPNIKERLFISQPKHAKKKYNLSWHISLSNEYYLNNSLQDAFNKRFQVQDVKKPPKPKPVPIERTKEVQVKKRRSFKEIRAINSRFLPHLEENIKRQQKQKTSQYYQSNRQSAIMFSKILQKRILSGRINSGLSPIHK